MKNIVVSNWLKNIVDKYSKAESTLISNGIDNRVFFDQGGIELHTPQFFNIEKVHIKVVNGVNPIQGSRLIFLLVAREEAAAFASAKKPLSGKES